MKIAHIGLAAIYTEGMTYQDNQLSEQNVRDGHEVLYVSNAEKYVDGKPVKTGYEDIILSTGVRLVRMPYEHIVSSFVSEKIRKVRGLYELLCDFRPDVILLHGICFYSALDAVRYKKEHPEIKLYADNHTADHNSGKNFLSMNVLHKGFYRYLTQKALPYLEKYLYISWSEKQYAKEVYGVPESIMEFYPLGGNLIPDSEYEARRQRVREELKITQGEYLFVHSGKLDDEKKTEPLLKAFSAVPELNARLIILGRIPDDKKEVYLPLIEADRRIEFLGWKNSDELTTYLCGCDLFLQPGGGSATMMNAVCLKCPVLSYPHEYYINDYNYGNFIWVKTEEEMKEQFRLISEGKTDLEQMSACSEKCAEEILDYRILASRLYR